jgi:hypothetical protein
MLSNAAAEPILIPLPPAARRPRSWRAPALAACLLAGLVVAACTVQLLLARAHLLAGARDASLATAALHDPLRIRNPAQRAVLRTEIGTARDQFAAARDDLSAWTPLLDHLGWVPRIGRELAAAGPAADVSYGSTDAALQLIDGLTPVLQTLDDRHSTAPRLPRLTAALARGQPEFVRARADTELASAALGRLPGTFGRPSVDRLLRRLRQEIPMLRTATAWLALTPELLGVGTPAHYLFVWQNPAELRATGGFLGASDFITVDRGRITHHFYGHILPHEISWPPMPLPEEMYTPESNWLFEDSNWSPDFPLSARFERWFYGEDTGSWASGVVDFLDTATPDLLRATGPVYLPGYHRWVNAANVTPLAQHFVSSHYNGPKSTASIDVARKHFFYAVLKALLARTEHLPIDRLPAVGAVLSRMVQRRELQLFDHRPDVEAAIKSTGADGRLSPGSGDYLYVVDDNRSYNKLNPYVHERAGYAVTITPSLWLDVTLTIQYYVAPSPPDLEGGGPNWGLWGTKHDYQDFLRVYVPRGAVLESMSGLDRWAPQPAYGATQFAGRLLIRENHRATVVIHYRVPPNVFAASDHRYHFRVQHQPGADLQTLQVTVRAGASVTVNGGRSYATVLPLDGDAGLAVAVGGQVEARPVRLPPLPARPDPYIPFASLRDRHHPL